MTLSTRVMLSALFLLFALTGRAPAAGIEVGVDERVELLTIVARLAGASEYTMPNSRSPYAERVESRFGKHRDHPAIALYRKLRTEHGASYDAVPSLALHLDGIPALLERIPFDQHPPRLDVRWSLPETRAFLVALRDFATVTDAKGFFESEREFYGKVEARLATTLEAVDAVPWFDQFFGAKAGARYRVSPGLLCGGGNYGAGVQFLDGAPEEVQPILGCHRWDDRGVPTFTADTAPLLVHELCHSYTNAIVDRHAEALGKAGDRMFAANASRMRLQAYSSGRTVLYESMVRACVVRYMSETQGEEAGRKQAASEASQGFTWVGELSKEFDRYVKDRGTFKTLDDFMPEVVRFFDGVAAALPASEIAPPKLVAMEPANGDKAVDPLLATLSLRFDRPMRSSWSFVGAKADIPTFVGAPAFDSTGTILTVTMTLEPGKTYRYWLNSDRFRGFTAVDGGVLEPIHVEFTVAGAPTTSR